VYIYVSCGRLRLDCGWRYGPAPLLAPAASGSVRCVQEMCQDRTRAVPGVPRFSTAGKSLYATYTVVAASKAMQTRRCLP